VRDEATLAEGVAEVEHCLSVADKIGYDPGATLYENCTLPGVLALAKATLLCALWRKESRGAHFRIDYPATQDSLAFPSIVSYDGGEYDVWLDKDGRYER
jgi:succinate dehydrogenase / fumarate reductase flavoprotein subunit